MKLPSPRHPFGLSRGFTLFEVLGALVLLALLLLGVYAGIRGAAQQVRSGMSSVAQMDEIRSTQQFLERELSQSRVLPFGKDDAGNDLIFAGDKQSLRFVASLPGYLGKLGPQLQQLKLVQDGQDQSGRDRYRLEASFAMLPPDGSPAHPLNEPEVLLRGIRDGVFRYRGYDANGQLTDWSDTWQDSRRLPALVRIDFQLLNGAEWPTMQIPLRIDPGFAQGIGGGLLR